MSATELAAAIRERRISSVEAVTACLRQIERHNGALNAVVTLDAEGALSQAREKDAQLARRSQGDGGIGALHGVPMTLKDCHATAGMRTTAGYPPLADYVPEHDGTIARRLKDAGAILLGKTNVSPLLADFQCSNEIFGRTNNPWSLQRTPGGSSGGSAVAVATGMAPFDVGSDIGGSIRVPAHCCGVYGFKPSQHRVSNYGHIPDLPAHPRSTRIMNCIGPLARTIDDLALVLGIIEGPDGFDTDVPPLALQTPAPAIELARLNLAWAGAFPGLPIAADIRATIARIAGALRPHVRTLDETLPRIDFDEQIAVRMRLRQFVRASIEQRADAPLRVDEYFALLDRRDHFIRAWERFLGAGNACDSGEPQYDALIAPVMMTTAFAHCPADTPVAVDAVPQRYDLVPNYCRPFNLTGHPAVALPVGFDRHGLPIGVQLVGARWSDVRLLAIARAIDPIVGARRRPPGYD
jgi:amidase